jgi:predicted porin
MKNMKMNKWTMGLAAAGIVSLSSVAQAQDAAAGAEALAASTTLSGYVSTGYHYGNGQGTGGENYFRAADTQNAFSLDVVDLKLSSAQGDGAMATGYTVELWMGPAASDIGTQDSGTGGTVELMQANIDLRLDVGNGIDLKVGQFGTIVGNEVYNYNENTFYTHSWGFAVEPTHHTGILASYDLAAGLTVGLGLANTTGNATNGSSGGNGSSKTWLASVSYTLPDSLGTYLGGSELYYGVVSGPTDSSTGGNGEDTEYHYASISTPLPIANLSHKLVWDHVEYGHATQADSNVLGYHLSYALNADTTINARAEIGNINADLDGDGTLQSVDSFENADDLQSLTLGVNHKIWENVTSRIEWRHDQHNSDAAQQGDGVSRGQSQDTIALNLIYSF